MTAVRIKRIKRNNSAANGDVTQYERNELTTARMQDLRVSSSNSFISYSTNAISTVRNWLRADLLSDRHFVVPYGRPSPVAGYIAAWLDAYDLACSGSADYDRREIGLKLRQLYRWLRPYIEGGQSGPIWFAKPCRECGGRKWQQTDRGFECRHCGPRWKQPTLLLNPEDVAS